MAEQPIRVSVQMAGEDVDAGRLWTHSHGRSESATFSYLPERSYLEIAQAIEERSARPTEDLRELWRRIVFTVLRHLSQLVLPDCPARYSPIVRALNAVPPRRRATPTLSPCRTLLCRNRTSARASGTRNAAMTIRRPPGWPATPTAFDASR